MMEMQSKHYEREALPMSSEQPGLSDTDSARKCEKHWLILAVAAEVWAFYCIMSCLYIYYCSEVAFHSFSVHLSGFIIVIIVQQLGMLNVIMHWRNAL